jgi:transcriptional regulator NrdR family protein
MMNCEKCNNKTSTINSRKAKYGTLRRHECLSCGHRFTTVEITKEEYESRVRKLKVYKAMLRALKYNLDWIGDDE